MLRARQTGGHPSAAGGPELPVTGSADSGLPITARAIRPGVAGAVHGLSQAVGGRLNSLQPSRPPTGPLPVAGARAAIRRSGKHWDQPSAASRSRAKGGAHTRSGRLGVAKRSLGFAASTAATMVPFVLLSILMLSPPDPALAPPDLVLVPPKTVEMGVCIPGPVTPGHRCAGQDDEACLTGLPPREPGGAGRPPKPAALCAARHARHQGICRGDRQPQPCPGPR